MASQTIINFDQFTKLVDYSLINNLNIDPDAKMDGNDHKPRQVYSGHYVPVAPTPIIDPEYISHSKTFFKELGLSDKLATDEKFQKIFSGELSEASAPIMKTGWATGYALSIYGTEYVSQCPFNTGNGYGDGRAISIFECVSNGQRWEMQLKGAGQTPYCRGGDGRAVLRSSVREFLAQDFMHALNVPTSRSLTLITSKSETVVRPWYSDGSTSLNPDIMVNNPVAISTRVAPSFLRVGQLELFSRRTRNNDHPEAIEELKMIVQHLIDREYKNEIDECLSFEKKIVELSRLFRGRLTQLVANWIRVGYCQGNFNSDNCAGGGFTLDYGPFGFCESFDPAFQPWTGGGRHFSFFNQPKAAEANYHMFCSAIRPLLRDDSDEISNLDRINQDFSGSMQTEMDKMWASKLGLKSFDNELLKKLMFLMVETKVDYTIFFHQLSSIPKNISCLKKSFYTKTSKSLDEKWQEWLTHWRNKLLSENTTDLSEVSKNMRKSNPKYTWREWMIVPAYQQAEKGDYSLIKELQDVLNNPYDEQSADIEAKYYQLKPN
ncbi:MAG: hypothetical protein HOJ35_01650, partial [Bdellovibrionales bacterium]|nr:hypothetical protein [Bdellovibrionales bacterium]